MQACSSPLRLVMVVVVLLLSAACARVDSDQARLCRLVLPALHSENAALTVHHIHAGPAAYTVRIAYVQQSGAGGYEPHWVQCTFGGGRLSRERQELVGLVLNGESVGDVRLHLLKRYWLSEPSITLLAPPLSEPELAALPKLPRGLAVALQHLLSALPQIAIYALIAPAYALIYGLVGRINLAFGELAIVGGQGALIGSIAGGMAGAVTGAGAGITSGNSPLLMLVGALLFALVAAATHGDFMARFVFVPLVNRPGQAVLVASVGLAVAGMEYIRIAQGDSSRWAAPLLNTPVMVARSGDFLVTMTESAFFTTCLALTAALALVALMRFSAFGRRWRACADEPQAAALFGINPQQVLIRAFAITSVLAGLAGFIMSIHYGGIGFSGGLGIGLKALIAAIAGGVGSVGGAMLGAVVIGGFEALWSSVLPLEHANMAVYSLLVVLLVLRPGGLFGFADGNPRRV